MQLALLCDRDGTLVDDVPYNADPDLVRPRPGVKGALDRARARGLRIGVVTNQSGIGRGWITTNQLRVVHDRLDMLLGPFDVIETCPHAPDDGCRCRKPEPGLVLRATDALGVSPGQCTLIGDRAADVEAARAAGAAAILVPSVATGRVPHDAVVAPTFASAIALVLGGGE
jgi:histidinol-phosphate phosphatase family protein